MKLKAGAWLGYLGLAMAVMAPLFAPGYLLLLDSPWTPQLPLPTSVDNSYLLFAALHYFSLVIPSQLLQKGLLVVILWLAGWGMHRLLRQHTHVGRTAAAYAGLLYAVNPFVYSRLMAGQYLVVFGYALMPWFIAALWRFLRAPDWRRAVRVAVWAVAISIVSIHSIFFMGLVMLASVVSFVVARRGRLAWRPLLLGAGIGLGLWLVASSYWIVPLVTGHSQTAQLVGRFDQRYVDAFKTVGDKPYGVVFNASSMYGFWLDPRGFYVLPKSRVPVWPVLAVVIIGLAAAGVATARRRFEVWALAAVALVALALGIGDAWGPLSGIYNWFVASVLLFKGYREPQKFIGLVVLAYAFLGALGADAGLRWLQRLFVGRGRIIAESIVPALLIVLPLAYTPSMLWGFGGQIVPTDYPADWYGLNRQLNADKSQFKVLFLPWHQYTAFGFTTNIIANPAQNFFTKPVIQGNNLELGQIYSQEFSPTSDLIQNQLLRRSSTITNSGKALAPIGVKYVVLAKNFDVADYAWLDHQTDLRLISNTATLRVYQNTAWQPLGVSR